MARRSTLLQRELIALEMVQNFRIMRGICSLLRRVRARRRPGHGAPKNPRNLSFLGGYIFSPELLFAQTKLHRSAAHLATVNYELLKGQYMETKPGSSPVYSDRIISTSSTKECISPLFGSPVHCAHALPQSSLRSPLILRHRPTILCLRSH